MTRRSTSNYPPNWKDIATTIKEETGWKCVRCTHRHDPKSGYTLTVHHLDGNRANCAWWNLAALCQRCHLRIQGKVIMERTWMFEHSEWFKPYVAGFYAHLFSLPDDKNYVTAHIEELIALGQGREEMEMDT